MEGSTLPVLKASMLALYLFLEMGPRAGQGKLHVAVQATKQNGFSFEPSEPSRVPWGLCVNAPAAAIIQALAPGAGCRDICRHAHSTTSELSPPSCVPSVGGDPDSQRRHPQRSPPSSLVMRPARNIFWRHYEASVLGLSWERYRQLGFL